MTSASDSRLRHFPVTWFATVMGLAGFAMAWGQAGIIMDVPDAVPKALTVVAGAVFVFLALLYTWKAFAYPDATLQEWRHPVRINFVPTVSIGLLLLAAATVNRAPEVSFVLWSVGTALNLALTVYVMNFWINHPEFRINHMNPAWFIPVVGNILVPGAGLAHGSVELSWFFFSIGLVFWLVLFAIVFYRVVFHDPLPDRLLPTLAILIAPPSVGFLSYVSLTGYVDSFARVLYYIAVFLCLLLVTQVQRLARLKFYLSWWAYSFPVAAFTLATLRMHRHLDTPAFHFACWVTLVALTLVIALLVVRTLIAVHRREVCVEEN